MGRNKISCIISYTVLKNSQMDMENHIKRKYFQLHFPNTLVNLYQRPYANKGNLNLFLCINWKYQYPFPGSNAT